MTATTIRTQSARKSSLQFDGEDVAEARLRLSILLTFLDGNPIPGHTEIENQIESLYTKILRCDCWGWFFVRNNPPFLQHATREQVDKIGGYFNGSHTTMIKERCWCHSSVGRIVNRNHVNDNALALLTNPISWGGPTKRIALRLSNIADEELFKRTPNISYSTTHKPAPVKTLEQRIVEQRRKIVRTLEPKGTFRQTVSSEKWEDAVRKLADRCGIDPLKFGEWVKGKIDLPEIEKQLRTLGGSLEPEIRINKILTLPAMTPAN